MRQEVGTVYQATNTAGTYFSEVQDLTHMLGFSYQGAFTNAGNITISLEASNDRITWDLITGSAATFAAPNTAIYNVVDAFYKYARMRLVVNSGTVTSNVTCNVKGA